MAYLIVGGISAIIYEKIKNRKEDQFIKRELKQGSLCEFKSRVANVRVPETEFQSLISKLHTEIPNLKNRVTLYSRRNKPNKYLWTWSKKLD